MPFFKLAGAASYQLIVNGKNYVLNQGEIADVSDSAVIDKMRGMPDIFVETDKKGEDLVPAGSGVAPLSVTKVANDEANEDGTITSTDVTSKKASKKKTRRRRSSK